MIVSVINLKGGVGKTTTAMHLAAVASHDGPCTVLDADNEHSAYEWAALAELAFDVQQAIPDRLARQAKELAIKGVVIIDGPPNSRDLLRAAATVADRILVPIKPTGLDVNRLRPTLEVLLDIEATKENMDTRILFTSWDGRRTLAREAAEVLSDFPVMQSKIRALARYEKAFGGNPNYLYEYTHVWRELINE